MQGLCARSYWNACIEFCFSLQQKADVTSLLIELLRHANADTRRRAAAELGVGGDRAKVAVPRLISLLDDPNPDVRKAAALAVSKLALRDEALAHVVFQIRFMATFCGTMVER